MIISDNRELTEEVLRVMKGTKDARLREILESFVTHLHSFVREVRLTEEEFRAAAKLIAELGQQTNDTHNEVVLMAGSLGVSSLVCLLNNGNSGNTETNASLLGPFWRLNSPLTQNGGSIVRSDTRGPALFMNATVRDKNGRAIEGAEVDVWHSSPVGLYENQDPEQIEMNLRGKFLTDENGQFAFQSVLPAGYPIPTSGIVGRLLEAQGRHPFRPAHVHSLIYKKGFKTLISQVYVNGTDYLDSDVQFGVTRALIGDFIRHDEPHSSAGVEAPWYSIDYTFVMERGEATLPMPPIK